MSALVTATILLGYGSLLFELTALHVPSVASTRAIWSRSGAVEVAYSPPYRRVFRLSRPQKLLLFMLPLLVTYGVYLYPLMTLWGSRDPLGDHLITTSILSDGLAAFLIVAGRAITLASVLTIRSDGRGAADAPALYTDGPFRHSRNPGLVGMYVFVTGLWLAGPSLVMLAGMLVYFLHMDFKVRMEEDYLQNQFREAYSAYRRRTSRYWP